MISLHTAGLLIVSEKKLLLAYSKNKQCFYLPGGKIHPGESPEEALCREISEELQLQIEKRDLKYYTHVTAAAFGEADGVVMEQECYFIHAKVDPHPSAEILTIKFFSVDDYLAESRKAPGAVMILEKLKEDGYID
jgi:8-oxo-dGTP pyrophosphatase MutT (NUDIX family)